MSEDSVDIVDFVPFTRPLRPDGKYREGEVDHLCELLENAWQKNHRDTLEIGRPFDNDPHLSDLAERLLAEIESPTYIGVVRTGGIRCAYVLHPAGVDLVRIVLKPSVERGTHLRGLERRLYPPLPIDYAETITDFAPELDKRYERPARPHHIGLTHDDRLGLTVSVSTAGLDEPVTMRVFPEDLGAFQPTRDILRQWAYLPRTRRVE